MGTAKGTVSRARFQCCDEGRTPLHPWVDQALCPASLRSDEHVSLHGPPGEVHQADVGPAESLFRPVGPDANHEVAFGDAAEHLPLEQERQTTEHRLLGHASTGRNGAADPLGQLAVVGHRLKTTLRAASAGLDVSLEITESRGPFVESAGSV